MEKYSDAIFYVDNGLYFTKQDIDGIFSLKAPDAEWIYKNPDTYKRIANTKNNLGSTLR